jgi:hypothetical protein
MRGRGEFFRASAFSSSSCFWISFIIEQPEVIEKILSHLGLWPAQAHSPPESIPA